MILGGEKKAVIANIEAKAQEGAFNDKVELGDPELELKERVALCRRVLDGHKTLKSHVNTFLCSSFVGLFSRVYNRKTKIIGLEKLKGIKGGAVITCNHYNSLDTTPIRKMTGRLGKRLYIVNQDTNFAMPGMFGYIMNYNHTIPITMDAAYINRCLIPRLEQLLKKHWVLIYPEQEMWFNYRKPRPGRRGAYLFAARCGVPVVSCFTEMRDLDQRDNDEFLKVRLTLHVLDPIYPDPSLSARENSRLMMAQDELQKKTAYERIYGKTLTYEVEKDDIAGWSPIGHR